MLSRRFKHCFQVTVGGILILSGFLLVEHFRGKIALAKYKDNLRTKGEKLTVQDLTRGDPQGDNGAPRVFAAIKQLKPGVVIPEKYPPIMPMMESGRAGIGHAENFWIEDKATNNWEQVRSDVQANSNILAQITKDLRAPVLDNKINYEAGSKILLTHLAPGKGLYKWFGCGTIASLHAGDIPEAKRLLLTQLAVPQLLCRDRIVISELVRFAISGINFGITWEALQTNGWHDSDLLEIQEAWSKQAFSAPAVAGLEGERIFSDLAYEKLRGSSEEMRQFAFANENMPIPFSFAENFWDDNTIGRFAKREIYCRVWPLVWSYQDQARSLELSEKLLELMREADRVRSYREVAPKLKIFSNSFKPKSLYDRLRYPQGAFTYLIADTVHRALQAETERSLVLTAIALKRYALVNGNYPESLHTLVPQFLPSIPIDYMDGTPIKYHRDSSLEFTLYSVGDDGMDDGGDWRLTVSKGTWHGRWYRKDVVWPKPALPEELIEWRKNQTAKH